MNYNKSKKISKHILSVMLNKEHTDDKEFVQWVTENKYAEECIRELSDEEVFSKKVRNYNHVDVEKSSQLLFDKITKVEKRKKNRKTLRIISSVAACIVLLIMVYDSIFITDSVINQPMEETIEKSSKIKSITNDKTAILVLHNGDKINLSPEVEERVKNSLTQEQNDTIPSKNKIITPQGVTCDITLSDGTRVWINENSELRFPAKFRGDMREVELFGEAYFEVTANNNMPFIVNSQNHSKIKVLGTKFNINTAEDKTYTTLVEGSVEVQSKNEKIVIKPSEQAIVSSGNGNIKVSEVDISFYIAWKDGKYAFKDETISNIMKKISTWYNVDIEYDNNDTTPNIKLSGSLRKYNTFTEVIEIMEATGLIEIKVKESNIIRIYSKM